MLDRFLRFYHHSTGHVETGRGRIPARKREKDRTGNPPSVQSPLLYHDGTSKEKRSPKNKKNKIADLPSTLTLIIASTAGSVAGERGRRPKRERMGMETTRKEQ